ncbi:MAG TPA: hypothetical protein VFM80_01855 [Gracilimonas sp.]|uniref:hypothetical protein n=1 Tax=Gracilimonas sp. TaxID=1974203 RepID=UPI002DA99654|nr:hypothetical protein [Gracilimonas sp.]
MLNSNDYIMRQIHQLSQVLAKVIAAVVGLKETGQAQQVFEITNNALNEQLELDLGSLLEMNSKEMIQTLEQKEGMNKENLEQMADLFYSIANTLEEDQKWSGKITELLQRSLDIYTHIEEQGNVYSIDRNHKIQEIKKLLG